MKIILILKFLGFVFVQAYLFNIVFICAIEPKYYSYTSSFIFINILISMLLISLLFYLGAKYQTKKIEKYYLNAIIIITLLVAILFLLFKPIEGIENLPKSKIKSQN